MHRYAATWSISSTALSGAALSGASHLGHAEVLGYYLNQDADAQPLPPGVEHGPSGAGLLPVSKVAAHGQAGLSAGSNDTA